jgi:hypothetical protein
MKKIRQQKKNKVRRDVVEIKEDRNELKEKEK